ncbi:MAG: four helix bundle protein [Bacteroidota bacterium]|jgi:four helix bundle protein
MNHTPKPYGINERCYEFSKLIVLFINRNEFKRIHYSLIDQLLRSSTSIGANVIEGRSGNSRRNLEYFFSIALRSANETKYWLCLIRDTININKTEINELILEANQLSNIIGKSILTLKTKRE